MNKQVIESKLKLLYAFGTAAVMLCSTPFVLAHDLIEAGRDRYQDDCAACHGADARGAGAVSAAMTVKPSDLTRLTKDNNGEFPEDYVRRVIDGRELPPAAHGETGMPVWGRHYKPNLPAYSEQRVQQRIDELVAYLRSVQIN